MTARTSPLKTLFAAALIAALGATAARADEPTPAALESARAIIVSSGIPRSFNLIVPQLLGELEHNVLLTRPELKDSLHATLIGLEPEFTKSEDGVIDAAARVLAGAMSEQELKETQAFFASPSGKKYVDAQPATFKEIVSLVQAWRQRLSVDILTRARVEMKKKGVDF